MKKFSTHCFRNFKKFIGELTATSAGINVAIEHTNGDEDFLQHKDPWFEIAKQYDIKVNGLEFNKVLSSAARLNIVNVYSGFDLYFAEYKKAYKSIIGNDWKKNDKETPLEQFGNNIDLNKIKSSSVIASHQLILINYYRLVRNAIVHPSCDSKMIAIEYYNKNENSINSVREHYKMLSAPNSFKNLNFHDVKIFCRILLDLLPLFDVELDPGNEKLRLMIPKMNPTCTDVRRENASIGFLQNMYGISKERAKEILAY